MVVTMEGAGRFAGGLLRATSGPSRRFSVLDVVAGPLWRDFFTGTSRRGYSERKQRLHRALDAGLCPGGPRSHVRGGRDCSRRRSRRTGSTPSALFAFAAGIVGRFRQLVSGSAPWSPTRWRPRPLAESGAGVQGRRPGRDGAEDGVHSGDRPEIRPEAHKPAEIPGLSGLALPLTNAIVLL